jgi:hypothetical protein
MTVEIMLTSAIRIDSTMVKTEYKFFSYHNELAY